MAEIINDTDIDVVAHVQGGPDPTEVYNLVPQRKKKVGIGEVSTVTFYNLAKELLATQSGVTDQDQVTLTDEESDGYSTTLTQLG